MIHWFSASAIVTILVVGCSGTTTKRSEPDTPDDRDASPEVDAGDGGSDAAVFRPTDALVSFRSGSRLEAQFFDVGGGAPKAFVGTYDSQLEHYCSFAPAADGVLRCLPNLGSSPTLSAGLARIAEPIGYLDVACQEPLYQVDARCEAQAFMHEPSLCGDRTVVRRLRKVEGAPSVYQETSDGCVADTTRNASGGFRLGDEVPAEDMVAAFETTADVRGPLTRKVYIAEDGAHIPGPVWISALETSCRATFPDEPTVCRLSTGTYIDGTVYYDNPSCSGEARQLAWSFVPIGCPPPAYAIDDSSGGGARKIGGRVDGVYRKDGDQCSAGGWWQSVYEVGEPVPLPDTYGKMLGTGRLQGRVVHSSSDTPLSYAADDQSETFFFDTQTGRECDVIENAAGDLRCVPGSLGGFSIREGRKQFSDADCTQPIGYCGSGSSCPETIYYSLGDAPTRCGALDIASMWIVDGEVTGTAYERDQSGACVPITLDLVFGQIKPVAWDSLSTVMRGH